MKKSLFFIILLSLIFVGCADVPDFPTYKQVYNSLENQDFSVKDVYFSYGDNDVGNFSYFYPTLEYFDKFGDKNKVEFNYIITGFYKNDSDSTMRTILVKMFRHKDMPDEKEQIKRLKIIGEL